MDDKIRTSFNFFPRTAHFLKVFYATFSLFLAITMFVIALQRKTKELIDMYEHITAKINIYFKSKFNKNSTTNLNILTNFGTLRIINGEWDKTRIVVTTQVYITELWKLTNCSRIGQKCHIFSKISVCSSGKSSEQWKLFPTWRRLFKGPTELEA